MMTARRQVRRLFASAVCVLTVAAASGSIRAQQRPAAAGEWRAYGADLANTKYSPLSQIDRNNFSRLQIAWRWKSADGFLSRTIPGGGELWANSDVIFEQLTKENPNLWRDGESPYVQNFKATPLMIGGRLFLNTPTSISSYNIQKEQIPGWTRGWDARTGKLKWTFRSIPRAGEFGIETWENNSWEYTGKVSGWSIFSADEELDYLYIPYNTAVRS
jgi:glucose dehydrogenase